MTKPLLRLVLATALVLACAIVSERAAADFTLVPGTVHGPPGPINNNLCQGAPVCIAGCTPVANEQITDNEKNYLVQSANWVKSYAAGYSSPAAAAGFSSVCLLSGPQRGRVRGCQGL